jgi:hypothetical protein
LPLRAMNEGNIGQLTIVPENFDFIGEPPRPAEAEVVPAK